MTILGGALLALLLSCVTAQPGFANGSPPKGPIDVLEVRRAGIKAYAIEYVCRRKWREPVYGFFSLRSPIATLYGLRRERRYIADGTFVCVNHQPRWEHVTGARYFGPGRPPAFVRRLTHVRLTARLRPPGEPTLFDRQLVRLSGYTVDCRLTRTTKQYDGGGAENTPPIVILSTVQDLFDRGQLRFRVDDPFSRRYNQTADVEGDPVDISWYVRGRLRRSYRLPARPWPAFYRYLPSFDLSTRFALGRTGVTLVARDQHGAATTAHLTVSCDSTDPAR